MEQNNFEKNVQQKLDEFKITPSDSVWPNIEKRIGKKDKDRRGIFILFFLILFLLSGGYWLLNSSKNNHKKNQQISNIIKKESNSKGINKPDSSFAKSKIASEINSRNADSESISTQKIKSSQIDFQNKTEKENEKEQRKLSDESVFKLKENATAIFQNKKTGSKETNNEGFKIALNNERKLIEKNVEIDGLQSENLVDNIKDSSENKISGDSFSNHLQTEKNKEELVTKNDSSAKKFSKKNYWILGLTFSGGASLIGKDILERNYPMADVNGGGVPSGGTPSYYYSASPIKNSKAFIAGIFIEKNISPKTKISLGVSYKYYSLINKVGNKIDSISLSSQYLSSSNSYYSSANTFNSYRNNFHYLELPVSIKFQLSKNKKLPLFWNAGVNISQLISSNALQFKSNPGVYYNDNSMFNKTQFGLSTGLSVTFFSQQKMSFTFGPYFYYSASSLSDQGLYGGKHFSFIGIRTEILFQKK